MHRGERVAYIVLLLARYWHGRGDRSKVGIVRLQWAGPLLDLGIQRSRIETDASKLLSLKLNAGVHPETFADHPAQRYTSKGV